MISPKLKDTDRIIKYIITKFNIDLSHLDEIDIFGFYKKIIYLYNRNQPIINIEQIDNDFLKIKKENIILSQKKRVQKLVENKYYHGVCLKKGMVSICLYCDTQYQISINQSNKNGYCCLECYKKSGTMFLNLQKKYLMNKGFCLNNLNIDQIKELYNIEKSKEIKISNKKRVITIRDKYENGFRDIAIKGNKNRKKKFFN